MFFRTAAIALTVVLPVCSHFASGQSTQPESRPATRPAEPSEEIKPPQLTDEQRDKISALWEEFVAADIRDKEAFEKACEAVLDEKELAVALLYEQFIEVKLSGEAAAKLISDLDSEKWKKREAASRKLIAKGFCQADAIQAAVESAVSAEARVRLNKITNAYQQHFVLALAILVRIDTDSSWALARDIARVKEGAGNAKFKAELVTWFLKIAHHAAWMLRNRDYKCARRRIANYSEIYQTEVLECAIIDGMKIPVDDENSPTAVMDIAVKLMPDNSAAYMCRGWFHHSFDRDDEAYDDLTKAIECSPENDECYFVRGELLLWTDRPKEAEADFSRAIELKPSEAEYYVYRARVYGELKQREKAVSDSTMAIELDPNNAENYVHRADIYALFEENENAIVDITAAISLGGLEYQISWWYYRRAMVWKKLGDMEKVIADLKKAVEVGYQTFMYSSSCNNLAWFYVTCEDPAYRDVKAAIEYATKACNDANFSARYLDTLACAYAEDGQWDKAIETQKKAIECENDTETKQRFAERLEGFKNHKTYLQQEADKKQAAPQSQPETQPETQPDTQPQPETAGNRQ